MNIQDAYNLWSKTYDSDWNLTRDLDQAITVEQLKTLQFKSILEVGSGTGKNTACLSQIGKQVFSLDFSIGMIKKAKEKPVLSNVFFCNADVTKPWSYRNASFDLVTCNLVLEHIEDLSQVFSEAYRTLVKDGRFFICELHPFRQYLGKKARFDGGENTIEINAFVHHVSEFVDTAESRGFSLRQFREWWHAEDQKQLPRLASFMFQK
jgi:ubiquinone/menaquinone biosynthesis C-methylase UbiE